jgi:hypothetical protein
MQFQPELREPFAKRDLELLRILLVFEPDGDVVSEAHDDHISVRVPAPPPAGSQVEDMMEVHVGEQRRRRAA